jgi:HEAT repeat protein
MSLFDFLTKENRDQRAFDRNLKRVLRRTRAKDERMDESIHFLADLGTEEALSGLLRRYDATIKSESMDRFEKELIYNILVDKGSRSIPPILKFIKSSDNVTWPIQALRSLTTEEKVVEALVEVLTVENTKDSFKPDKKVQLLQLLSDHVDTRVPPVVAVALKDFDETVRYGAVEALFIQDDETAREPLLEALTDPDEESQRIRKRILKGFVDTGWTVRGFRKAVEAQLESHQWVDKKGCIKEQTSKK